MKYIAPYIMVSIMVLAGCKEISKNDTVATTDVMQEVGQVVNSKIPVLNFSELEAAYLQIENDTTYVVNFWATWCKPCIKELPAFEQLKEAHKNDKLQVVLVSLDFPEKLETGVIPFIEKKGLTSKVVLLDDPDANSWIPKVSDTWSGAIPATVIVNKKGKKFFERSFTYDELEKEITSL